MKKLLLLLPLFGAVLYGCGDASVQVTKDQEEAFRHPPSLKDAPPDILEKMRKSRERGAKIAAERMKASGVGGNTPIEGSGDSR